MNQILSFNKDDFSKSSQDSTAPKRKKIFLRFSFLFSSIIAIFSLFYYLYTLYDNNKKEKISHQIADNFSITSLYASSSNPAVTKVATVLEENKSSFSVIGLIEINSIRINYPILSSVSTESLKVAPCRFFGPMPNEVGNLCIAGHNYNSYKFFSKLKELKIGDIISIYDLSGKKIDYAVYDSFEINSNDTSCTNQETNGKREITLITCNNIKDRRRVIKAKEKG